MGEDFDPREIALTAARDQVESELRGMVNLAAAYRDMLFEEGFTQHCAEDVIADFLSQTLSWHLEEARKETDEDD